MKENVFDVLIYLFERFLDDETESRPDADQVRSDLIEAGFPNREITKALDWLDALGEEREAPSVSSPTFRVFSGSEMRRLDIESRGLLMFLEQCDILTPASRELVLDRVMAIDEEQLTLENLKWIVLMVLFSQPDEELAFARMEHLVYGSNPTYLH